MACEQFLSTLMGVAKPNSIIIVIVFVIVIFVESSHPIQELR